MQQPQQQSKLITYLIILIGAVGGYFYYSQVGGSTPTIEPIPVEAKEDWKTLKDLKIDIASLLEDEGYRNLQVFGESPVNPGVRGRNDPFSQ